MAYNNAMHVVQRCIQCTILLINQQFTYIYCFLHNIHRIFYQICEKRYLTLIIITIIIKAIMTVYEHDNHISDNHASASDWSWLIFVHYINFV